MNAKLAAALAVAPFVLSGLLVPAPAPAQSAAEDATIEEVIVTSRKLGAESVQDLPMSVTALGEQTLKNMSVADFEDFAYQVPGLTFLDQSPGERRYVVRGIQSAGQQQVAVYYDEVPLPGIQSSTSDSGSQTTDLKLYDIERVEVLRGPQGTTFGANSQSGTVRFITKKPVMNEFEAFVGGQLSSTSHSSDTNWNMHAVINLPLTDTLAARVLAYDGRDGGYLENNRCRPVNPAEDPSDPGTELACLNLHDFNDVETTGLRANLRWQPSERATVEFMAWYQDRQPGGDNRFHPFDTYGVRSGTDNGDFDNVADFTFFQTGDFLVGDYAQTPKPDDQLLVSLTGEFELPFANMTATGSFYDRDFEFKFDSTWIITFLFENIDPTFFETRADLVFALTDQRQNLEQNQFELRFASKDPAAPLQWVAGAFFRSRDSKFQSFVPVINQQGLPFDPGTPFTIPPTSDPGAGIPGCHPCVFARLADKKIDEIALFADADWRFNEQWNLNIGLRWFEVDQEEFGERVFEFAAFAPNPPTLPPNMVDITDNELITKVTLGYRANDHVNLYGVRSEGFRLGGTNNQGIIAVPELFEADELVNWELGLKTNWRNNRVRWNTALFHLEWDNLQVAGQDPTGAFGFIGNAGKAEVQGLEMELHARPNASWDFTASLTWLPKRELTEDQVSDEVVAPGLAGDKIPRIPEVTAAFTAQYNYSLPLEDWTGFARLEGIHKGKSETELRPTSPNNRFQDAYEIVNARLGFRNERLDLDVMLFAENLFDKAGDVFIGVGNGEPTFKYTNRPRTVGLEVIKYFGRR